MQKPPQGGFFIGGEIVQAWLKSLLTDPNGLWDDARVCAVLMVLAYIGLSGYDVVWLKQHFDMQQFGVGAGALSAGIGGWFKFRGNQ